MQKLDSSILSDVIKPRPQESFKGTFGKILLIGGNHQFGGAIIMATAASVYCGTGLVTVATDPINASPIHSQLPEAMVIDFRDAHAIANLISQVNTVVIGPGLGEEAESKAILEKVFALTRDEQTVVIDGSAITLMARDQISQPKGHLIYTPHQMEWQRLSGIKIADQTSDANQKARDELKATVILKKHHTEIYTAREIYQLPIGSAAQAIGGMGDTLAGMVGGFTAQFRNDITKAALAATYAHSAIADELAEQQYIVLPHQISQALPTFMKKVSLSESNRTIGFHN
ncbi:NAD(P)H-hydrate dehydratase [uncultured Limosilactobacillus sp.]|uniref:NAD(P)H-hydrate dehydratase n=1 Tax=uncultured Limosilactobacillus sp. TaxID=2837629 RepID=UPI0025EEAEF4|nr:NAD(P)H-hydrate dehydratase [uncultured Limosilactobacillus sp.]